MPDGGRGVEDEAKKGAGAQNAQEVAGLEAAERATFIALMRRVIGNMQRG